MAQAKRVEVFVYFQLLAFLLTLGGGGVTSDFATLITRWLRAHDDITRRGTMGSAAASLRFHK